MRRILIFMCLGLAACGAKPRDKGRDAGVAMDAAPAPPRPVDAREPQGLGSIDKVRARFDAECAAVEEVDTLPREPVPFRRIQEHALDCETIADPARQIMLSRFITNTLRSDSVDRLHFAFTWKEGARPALCDSVGDHVVAYLGDLTGAPAPVLARLATLMREKQTDADRWFEYSREGLTVYFRIIRVDDGTDRECAILLTDDFNRFPAGPGPATRVE